jgi:hypothetical protein
LCSDYFSQEINFIDLLARLLGSLSQGPPFGLLSFEVMRDKNGVMKSFYFSEKNSWTCKNPDVSVMEALRAAHIEMWNQNFVDQIG